MVLEIQKLASHITQVIHAEPIFANYFYLDQVKNRQVPAAIIHNLVYQLFSLFINKKTGEEAKSCFDRFCEPLPEQINLDGFKGQEYQTIISSMVNQHEAFMCKTMSNTFKKETFSTFFSLKLVTISGRSAGFRIKKKWINNFFKSFQAVRGIGLDARKKRPKKEEWCSIGILTGTRDSIPQLSHINY